MLLRGFSMNLNFNVFFGRKKDSSGFSGLLVGLFHWYWIGQKYIHNVYPQRVELPDFYGKNTIRIFQNIYQQIISPFGGLTRRNR